MKKTLFSLLLLLLSSVAVVNAQSCVSGTAPQCKDSQTISISGHSITIKGNGGLAAGFEELITGSPSAISVVIKGCAPGGTCVTLDTYTTVANAIRNPTIVLPYDHYIITATWTGGTTPTVVVNTNITTALLQGGGSGTVYLNTVFNEGSTGTTIAGTLPAVYTGPSSGWSIPGGAAVSATFLDPSMLLTTTGGAYTEGPVIDVGHSDYIALVNLTDNDSGFGAIYFRYQDVNNMFVLQPDFGSNPNALRLYTYISGSFSEVADSTFDYEGLDIFIRLNGSTITVESPLNTVLMTYTSTQFETATKFGFGAFAAPYAMTVNHLEITQH